MWEVDAADAPSTSSLSAQLKVHRSAVANLCLSHAYFKPLLADLLRQTLPPDASAGQDIVQWVDKHIIIAQLMVNSILDAGTLLSDLYESCPQMANGGDLLRMYTDYIAKVNSLLSAPLAGFSVHSNAEVLQSLCSLDEQAYLSVSQAMILELQKVLSQPALEGASTLAFIMQSKMEEWNQAGHIWVEGRKTQWQTICMKGIRDIKADWEGYQQEQKQACQQAAGRAEAYQTAVQKLLSTAGQLLQKASQVQHGSMYGTLRSAALAQQVWEACKQSKHALQPLQLNQAGFHMCDDKMMVVHFTYCSHSNVRVNISCSDAVFIQQGELCHKMSFVPGHGTEDTFVHCLIDDSTKFQLDVCVTRLSKAQKLAKKLDNYNVLTEKMDSSNMQSFQTAALSNMTEDTECTFPGQQRICIRVDKVSYLECLPGKYSGLCF